MKEIKGEYGLRIRNIKAATLLSYNAGVRTRYEYTDAILSNSLFLNFLKKHGLRVWKGESTRDVICLDFSFGTRSFDEELAHAEKGLEAAKQKGQDTTSYEAAVEFVRGHEGCYEKLSKEEVRERFYTQGVDVRYGNETIHYLMLFRNPSKAKTGQCMFICDRLYDKARKWLTMGLAKPGNTRIVELSAYAPLTTSSIVGTVHIPVEDVVILKDQSSFCRAVVKVVSAAVGENGKSHCVVSDEEREVENVLWDGMALIDESVFPDWANGMVLLRNHFFKACAFKTRLGAFFRDWCAEHGEDYFSYEIEDMFGRKHRLCDIKVLTTDNAIKWKKFRDVMGRDPYEYWCKRVRKDGEEWGIVKTDHPSKLDDVQQMSYQMVNTLPIDKEEVGRLAQTSLRFIDGLKNDPEAFAEFLRKNANEVNHFEMMAALYDWNNDIANTDWFRNEKKEIVRQYVQRLKSGKITVPGDNLTMCGNPYALLLYSVGEDWANDPTLATRSERNEGIEVYTKRFEDGERLCAIRSPNNSPNNLAYFVNRRHELMDKYFDFSQNIIAVNCLGTDIQSRLNGCDFDSDFVFTTNDPVMVEAGRRAYTYYPTIVNALKESSVTYGNTMEDYALMDNRFARSQLAIGESSNLAQLAMSYYWGEREKDLYDIFVILSVVAQIAIDSIKRLYEVDCLDEIKRIKNMPIMKREKDFPEFMKYTRKIEFQKNGKYRPAEDVQFDRDKINRRINYTINCPMNHLLHILNGVKTGTKRRSYPMSDFFIRSEGVKNKKRLSKMRKLAEDCKNYVKNIQCSDMDGLAQYAMISEKYEEVIRRMRISCSKDTTTMNRLIEIALDLDTGDGVTLEQRKKYALYSKTILRLLFKVDCKKFLKSFKKGVQPTLMETPQKTMETSQI